MSELAQELRRFAHADRNFAVLDDPKAKPQDTDLSRILDIAADRIETMEGQVLEFYQLCAALRKVEHYRTTAPEFPWPRSENDRVIADE